jgi:DNA-binding PadR family transcriptional regulator
MPSSPRPDSFLPLTPAVFHILLSLADVHRHGYGIAKDVEDRTERRVRLGPGTLYGTLTRMVDAGLVEERSARGRKADADDRRRYYQITALGRSVASAEARRLAALVDLARERALLPAKR